MNNPIANNPALGVAVVVVLLAVAALVTLGRGGDKPSGDIWFYDLGTKQLYAAPSTTLPPAAAPSGAQGVAAVVMACGDCGGETFTAYLQTYSAEYRKAIDAGADIPPKVMMEGLLVRSVESEPWVSAESDAGRALIAAAAARCPGAAPTICQP